MTAQEKVLLYEEVLNLIAAWKYGDDLDKLDEPSSASKAREVLNWVKTLSEYMDPPTIKEGKI